MPILCNQPSVDLEEMYYQMLTCSSPDWAPSILTLFGFREPAVLCVKLVGFIYLFLALSVKKPQRETAYNIFGQPPVLDFSYLPMVYCTYKMHWKVNYIPLAVTDFIAIFNKPGLVELRYPMQDCTDVRLQKVAFSPLLQVSHNFSFHAQ